MTADKIKAINGKYPVFLADLIEDNKYYLNIVKSILKINGIENIREFVDPVKYEQALQENPDLTPHIALVDYRFDGSVITGLDIAKMLISRARNKKSITKVIMITGYENAGTIIEFFHIGGFSWINKDQSHAEQMLKERIQLAVVELKEALEERAFLDELRDV